MIECIQNIEINYNESDSIESSLNLMKRNTIIFFEVRGATVYWVEIFYKKGYEEKLFTSLKRMPAVHTV